MSSQVAKAQMESDEVDLVSDFRIGESPSSAKYINRADLKVFSRAWFRAEMVGVRGEGDCGTVNVGELAELVGTRAGNGSKAGS